MTSDTSDINETCVLSPAALAAWQGFISMHGALVRDLDALLRSTANLSVGAFAVLHLLGKGESDGLRLTDLAEQTQITISGISRIVQSLDEQQLIQRLPDPDDGRATRIALTEAGTRQLTGVMPDVYRFIHERFVDRFSEPELATMAGYWDRLNG